MAFLTRLLERNPRRATVSWALLIFFYFNSAAEKPFRVLLTKTKQAKTKNLGWRDGSVIKAFAEQEYADLNVPPIPPAPIQTAGRDGVSL